MISYCYLAVVVVIVVVVVVFISVIHSCHIPVTCNVITFNAAITTDETFTNAAFSSAQRGSNIFKRLGISNISAYFNPNDSLSYIDRIEALEDYFILNAASSASSSSPSSSSHAPRTLTVTAAAAAAAAEDEVLRPRSLPAGFHLRIEAKELNKRATTAAKAASDVVTQSLIAPSPSLSSSSESFSAASSASASASALTAGTANSALPRALLPHWKHLLRPTSICVQGSIRIPDGNASASVAVTAASEKMTDVRVRHSAPALQALRR